MWYGAAVAGLGLGLGLGLWCGRCGECSRHLPLRRHGGAKADEGERHTSERTALRWPAVLTRCRSHTVPFSHGAVLTRCSDHTVQRCSGRLGGVGRQRARLARAPKRALRARALTQTHTHTHTHTLTLTLTLVPGWIAECAPSRLQPHGRRLARAASTVQASGAAASGGAETVQARGGADGLQRVR